MKFEQIRSQAISLPGVTEEPHFDFVSFRVMGKIFITAPPDEEHVHRLVGEQDRELALTLHPGFAEKPTLGARVVGLRIALSKAGPGVVRRLIRSAWEIKVPGRLVQSAGMQ